MRVLEQRRDRGVVFRAGDEDAVMRHDHLLELERVGRRAGLGFEIAVVERQRIVGERNAGDVGVGQRQLLGRQRGKPRVVRAGADRAGEDEDFGSGIGGSVDAVIRISCRESSWITRRA